MKKWFQQAKNEKGLTLIELLAVVVILGIIAAIAVPSIGAIINNSKKDAAVANAQQILSSAKLYVASTNMGEAGSTTLDSTKLADYVSTINDPWNNNPVTNYTVTIASATAEPSIVIEYSKCKIEPVSPTLATSNYLSENGRDACANK